MYKGRLVFWLCILLSLFIFRVCAQLVQCFFQLPFLPPFHEWYSGALAYPWLLVSQVLIIALMLCVIVGFIKQNVRPKYKLGVFLLGFGAVYFSVMVFRLIAALTFAAEHVWLGAKIPAFFHIALALFVILVGYFHFKHSCK